VDAYFEFDTLYWKFYFSNYNLHNDQLLHIWCKNTVLLFAKKNYIVKYNGSWIPRHNTVLQPPPSK